MTDRLYAGDEPHSRKTSSQMLKALFQKQPDLKLAVVESLTGGRLQARIVSESGASDFFVGGMTAYTAELKIQMLGVDRAIAIASNCVSAEVARQMARGVCVLMKCGISVATTGYAEPDPMEGVIAAKAHWAVCHFREGKDPVFVDGYAEFPGADRIGAQDRAADAALNTLKSYLESLPPAAI